MELVRHGMTLVSLLTLTFNLGDAISCYSCTSIDGSISNCDDPFDPTGIDVHHGYTVCSYTKALHSAVSVTLRGGLNAGASVNICTPVTVRGVTSMVCLCDTNLCNGAKIPRSNAAKHSPGIVNTVATPQISQGDAISCYSCTSIDGSIPNCDDPFDPTGIAVVNGFNVCSYTKTLSSAVPITMRTGMNTGAVNTCLPATAAGVRSFVCLCDTDLCNGAKISYPANASPVTAATTRISQGGSSITTRGSQNTTTESAITTTSSNDDHTVGRTGTTSSENPTGGTGCKEQNGRHVCICDNDLCNTAALPRGQFIAIATCSLVTWWILA